MNTTTYPVEGMSCGHCARAVEGQLRGISGVTVVEVDVDTGQVTVGSDGPVDRDVVRSAVEAAGYRLGV